MPSALIKMKVTGKKKGNLHRGKGRDISRRERVCALVSVCVCLYVNMRSIKANIIFFLATLMYGRWPFWTEVNEGSCLSANSIASQNQDDLCSVKTLNPLVLIK